MSQLDPPLTMMFQQHRERLRKLVQLRMDERVRARIDASDVIQEAFIEAAQRFSEYDRDREVSPFVWLRFLTVQKLMQLQRRHLGAQVRAVQREVPIRSGFAFEATSAVLAAQLVGDLSSPSRTLARAEERQQVEEALNELEDLDREVLALRHFEQLTNTETAEVLEITPEAAYKRYIRAIKRLRQLLKSFGEGSDEQ